MALQSVYFELFAAVLLAVPVAGIAVGILTAFRPDLQMRASRTLGVAMGMAMVLVGLANVFIQASLNAVFMVLVAITLVMQLILHSHDRRLAAIFGGLMMSIVGVWFAAKALSPDEPLRYDFFWFGELILIIGVVLTAGAWQGWALPLDEDDNARPENQLWIRNR